MGFHYDELFPGRFLKSGQFKGRDVTLTIAGIRVEEMPEEKGGTRGRGILAFRETKLELVLNRTNGECLKAMFGVQTDSWIGRRVTFFPANIEAFGGNDTAIRVRGSPDLERDMDVAIHLPRRKPIKAVMRKTASKGNSKPAAQPPVTEQLPAGVNQETGEVPFDEPGEVLS